MAGECVEVQAVRWSGAFASPARETLAVEEPLEIRLRGRAVTVTMRTPGREDADGRFPEDAELAAGFLLSEGVVRDARDIERLEPCVRNEWGNVINVHLRPLVHVDFDRLTRHVYASSSCGLCGKASIDGLLTCGERVQSKSTVNAAAIGAMMETMRGKQATFDRTGGLHAAGLFAHDGTALVVREDIGRHNTVDKAIGRALLDGVDTGRLVLVVSGRASFEIVQKAAMARLPIVAAVSAPSSLAVRCAAELNMTLAGFVREDRLTVYTSPERVVA